MRFLHDPTVPFTNNQAERDGRMMSSGKKSLAAFALLEGGRFALLIVDEIGYLPVIPVGGNLFFQLVMRATKRAP